MEFIEDAKEGAERCQLIEVMKWCGCRFDDEMLPRIIQMFKGLGRFHSWV